MAGEDRRATAPPEPQPEAGGSGLSAPARLYLAAAYGAAALAAVCAVAFSGWPPSSADIVAFAALTLLATASQLFMVEAPNRQSYHATPAFLITAALVLPPGLLVPLVVVALVPEWVRYRYPWYIQTFNISTYLINALGAWAVFDANAPDGLSLSWPAAVGAVEAGVAFTALNHAMVAAVLWLARGMSLRESGVASRESLETDLALIGVGTGMAVFWTIEPLLIVLEILPLLLFYRALYVPRLQEEARRDAKTGLLGARRFMEVLNEEMERAAKAGRPVAVAMADLDLFREVNNSLGHLAGDQVLKGVADIMNRSVREDDVVGRFGGEEFLVLLRSVDAAGAMAAAERIRSNIEATPICVTDSPEPVRVTISLGVAVFPNPCPDTGNLVRLADLAVYRSKINGRNRVTLATPEMEEDSPSDHSYRAILETLAFALDARGATVGGNTLRITALALAVAREMGVEKGSPEWKIIEQASLLHDVGKLAISSTVLYKQGPLSDEEWEEMRMHPETGWSMLRQVPTLRPAAEIVRAHHEHYDGGGYPRGLAGADIPLGARIFAVVDAFDAITSERPYRAAQSEAAALDEILRNSGAQFDARVVDALFKALGHEQPSVEQVTTLARPAA